MRANHARRGRKEKNPIVETAPSKSNGDSATSWTTDDERIAARAIRYVLSQHRRHLDHRQQEKVTLEALDELLDKPREGVADVFFTAIADLEVRLHHHRCLRSCRDRRRGESSGGRARHAEARQSGADRSG
jgi:hypothetical protein